MAPIPGVIVFELAKGLLAPGFAVSDAELEARHGFRRAGAEAAGGAGRRGGAGGAAGGQNRRARARTSRWCCRAAMPTSPSTFVKPFTTRAMRLVGEAPRTGARLADETSAVKVNAMSNLIRWRDEHHMLPLVLAASFVLLRGHRRGGDLVARRAIAADRALRLAGPR